MAPAINSFHNKVHVVGEIFPENSESQNEFAEGTFSNNTNMGHIDIEVDKLALAAVAHLCGIITISV